MLPSTLRNKHQRLQALVGELRSVAVAFSAGADSTLVLKIARDVLGAEHVVAATGRSASVPEAELADARDLAARIGVEHQFLDTDEFSNADYLKNPANRCYFCKSTLYAHLERFLRERGLHAAINGTNADDLGDYRPGLAAADEFRVRSPLAEVGLTKAEVRELSHELGLPTHDKPASPCLSSRVPYGDAITPEKLRMIESAERFLHQLGIRECRVRHHDTLARIEVPANMFDQIADNRASIDAHFVSLGYQSVALDPRGFRSGSLNEVITLGVSAPVAQRGQSVVNGLPRGSQPT